ncbi:MAG: cytochrome c [Acidobacteriota bacterium]|nr:cytochrome c [Acidobacteriota bacterium]
MQKILKLSLLFVFLAAGFFVFSSRASAVLPSAEMVAADNSPAHKLYINNCARCHGADGKSQTELGRLNDAPDLTQKKASRRRAISVITHGADSMPAFGKKLSKAEIASLVNYIRAF